MTDINVAVSTLYSDAKAQQAVRNLLTAGANVSLTYDETTETVTIDAPDTSRSDEEIQDVLAGVLQASGSASLTYDDTANTLTIDATDTNTQLDPAHTNPTYDSNEDGTIDTDVNNAVVATDELSTTHSVVTGQFDQPPITALTNATFQLDNAVHFVDTASNSPFPGRGYHRDYYFDPPYEARNVLPNHSGDGTASPSGVGAPAGADFVAVLDDYIFAAESNPVILYRAPYSDAFATGTFSWTNVLTGQAGSSYQIDGGRYFSGIEADTATATLLVGEEDPDSLDPIIYRSTDSGATFTQAFQATDPGIKEFHVIANAPEPDRFIATAGDGPGDRRFLESLDGGATWTRKQWGFEDNSQSVGVGFWTAQNGDRLMLFTEDRGGYRHGPWFVNYDHSDPESAAAKGLLTSTNARLWYENENLLEYAMWADDEEGIIYITMNDPTDGLQNRFYYLRGIGDHPNTLDVSGSISMFPVPSHDWIVCAKTRFPRLTKGR